MSRIKQTNGSVIIAALILTLVLGALVGVYLNTVVQEEEFSYRSRMAFQAVNVAEAGIDYAIYSFITTDWSQWEAGDNGYYRSTFEEITNPPSPDGIDPYSGLGTNENYSIKVYAQKGDPGAEDPEDLPKVIAEGTITLNNGISVSRQIMVRLQYGASDDPRDGGFWGNGILAKTNLTFNGNSQAVDSFNSNNDLGLGNVESIYDTQAINTSIMGNTVAGSGGSVASMSVEAADINLGNADVYGSVATGALENNTDPDEIVGPNGSITNSETSMENDESFDGQIDADYLSYDFYASLPDVDFPPPGEVYETTYTDNLIEGGETALERKEFRLDGLNLTGQDTLTISGHVTLVIDGDLKTSGQAQIVLADGADVEIIVSGDINLTGGGILNAGNPPSLSLFNTGVDTDIKIAGNAAFSGAIYAPNSNLELSGGGSTGEFYGAVVAGTVTMNGNYAFHYDEALSIQPDSHDDPDTDGFIPEVHSWIELTDFSEIRNMATILDDGL